MDILTRRSQIRHPTSKSLILNETHQLLDDCEEHFGQIKLNEQEKQKIDTLAVFPTVVCISTPRHDRTYSVRHPSIAYYSQVKGIFNCRSLRTLIYLTFIGVEAQSDISSSRQPLALLVCNAKIKSNTLCDYFYPGYCVRFSSVQDGIYALISK